MSPPPTSIDGTEITGATIDGQQVEEITIDGQTVFTAAELPVAYSNLVAWYPFDSTFYGGANADDVTALFNPGDSGDSTAFDGTVNGATYQSSGGVTDTNVGANSGAFAFAGGSEEIQVTSSSGLDGFVEMTAMAWTNVDDFQNGANSRNSILGKYIDGSTRAYFLRYENDDLQALLATDQENLNNSAVASNVGTQNVWAHTAFTWAASTDTIRLYFNGAQVATGSSVGNTVGVNSQEFYIGDYGEGGSFDGTIDDVRIYNKALTGSEINQIYLNTEP